MPTGDTYVLHDGEQVTVSTSTPELLAVEAVWAPLEVKPFVHLHPSQDERFTIHEGEFTVRIGDDVHVLRAGQSLEVPRGTVHSMWNGGEVAVRATWEIRPALNTEGFFRAVHEARRTGPTDRHGMMKLLPGALVLEQFRAELRLAMPGPVERVAVRALAAAARLRGHRAPAAPPATA